MCRLSRRHRSSSSAHGDAGRLLQVHEAILVVGLEDQAPAVGSSHEALVVDGRGVDQAADDLLGRPLSGCERALRFGVIKLGKRAGGVLHDAAQED